MIYLPDTNAFSRFLGGRSESLVLRMTQAFAAGELRLSVMVLAELEFGAEKFRAASGNNRFTKRVQLLRNQLEAEAITGEFTRHYASVRLVLETGGRKIGDRDTIIAAHALSLGATVVTANEAEFSRVPGLRVENWEVEDR